MVELRGLEPLTSTLPVLRTSQLYYSPEHTKYITISLDVCQQLFLKRWSAFAAEILLLLLCAFCTDAEGPSVVELNLSVSVIRGKVCFFSTRNLPLHLPYNIHLYLLRRLGMTQPFLQHCGLDRFTAFNR